MSLLDEINLIEYFITTFQKLWLAPKVVPGGKFIAVQASLREQELSNHLTLHLKEPEKEATQVSRRKEIVTMRVEGNTNRKGQYSRSRGGFSAERGSAVTLGLGLPASRTHRTQFLLISQQSPRE